MEAEGDVLGYGAGGDDGNGVVGGAEIGDADQGGDAEFGSPLAADVAGQPGDDEVDAAVVAEDRKSTRLNSSHSSQSRMPSSA